ncbi:hypothetical protein OG585_54435 (plasmid) [Streptomyces sp. NBC_01340]|uniref:hypothetical protein n=1 Tax=unclassified Streptomyces TaxID=2593676 RepID=UPI00225551DD|nr:MULTISPECIES: hypothetical protein [unclassified Streptomyces]MCX4461753.1 hypothetical protein [Streptomyces sp. NBC_01719]MCX4490662.1 hypothetical protein [Streptomyces sp. NBC_01728]MCX4598508.1 hypothetical protein [Streptomyces sp. NBC_01549]WSI45718.1 hypothetical protein OG585_54435 [Streptomyces sp. NBC_01340]
MLGLLEAREKRVREELARLREEAEREPTALGDAERTLERLVDARVTVTEVLAGPPFPDAVAQPVVELGERAIQLPAPGEGRHAPIRR